MGNIGKFFLIFLFVIFVLNILVEVFSLTAIVIVVLGFEITNHIVEHIIEENNSLKDLDDKWNNVREI